MFFRRFFAIVLIVTSFHLVAPRTDAQTTYTLTNFGLLSHAENSNAYGINNFGEVVGNMYSAASGNRAFVWSPGTGFADIGAGQANAINSSGVVVGGTGVDAFMWTPNVQHGIIGSTQTLPVRGGGLYAVATDINDANVVVANSYNQGFDSAYRWTQAGGAQSLGGDIGYSTVEALGINNANQVVGFRGLHPNTNVGVAYRTGPGENISFAGSSNIALASATDINDSGQTVGFNIEQPFNSSVLIAYLDGTRLGTLPGASSSIANAVNNNGDVVGYNNGASNGAFLWTPATGMERLSSFVDNLAGWDLTYAMDINDKGQIVGFGTYNGNTTGFLLTPDPPPAPPVPPTVTPEMPGLWAFLAGLGATGMGALRRRRKK